MLNEFKEHLKEYARGLQQSAGSPGGLTYEQAFKKLITFIDIYAHE